MNNDDTTVIHPEEVDANLDPITGERGAHPLGVGTGAVGGGITGAAIGSAVGGPVGAVVGAVVGGVGGGLAGKGLAEMVNPTIEHEYWSRSFQTRHYVPRGSVYEDYGPAYQFGWESYTTYGPLGKTFEDVEPVLERSWEERRGASDLDWESAKDAVQDAWQRVARTRPKSKR